MISQKQIKEIREHLERAQNPVFFYDNDADGLCSYVLLRKFIDRGRGVAVRTHPGVDVGYLRKLQELNADYVFVLDRPFLGSEFVEGVKELGIPIVWIDHHDVEDQEYGYENLFVYNCSKGKNPSFEPVTYWSYRITGRIEDIWIAIMGCIADHHMPDFADDFKKKYREYWGSVKKPFDAYYGTGIGLLARSLAFGLKDSITHVVYLQNFLISCKGPGDMLLEIDSNSSFGRKFRELKKKYDVLVDEAARNIEGDLIFYSYGGELSISADISNELSHKFPGKYIIVAYKSGLISNLSIRGDDVKGILEKILPNFEGASGGGHEGAVGARVRTEDLDRFKSEFSKLMGSNVQKV